VRIHAILAHGGDCAPRSERAPAEELRALVLTQHKQLVSAEDKLTTTQEQLLSRERKSNI